MRARFLLGRAGAGKTFSCLEEARRALKADREGAPLIFLAPKQATFQLERQLLSDPALGGYTRLRILSFERLAQFVLEQLGQPVKTLLSEQGRTMALRALLLRRRANLQIFRSGAGLARFAQDLSQELREWQRRQFTPEGLLRMAERKELSDPLRRKLHDLSALWGDYLGWLEKHQVQDSDCLLNLAAQALEKAGPEAFSMETLWMDGFAEMSAQELSLLTAVAARCQTVTLAFCLDPAGVTTSWLSLWSGIESTRQECWRRLRKIPGAELREEIIGDGARAGRFAGNAALRHLEEHWTSPSDFGATPDSVRIVRCPNPETEAIFAAQEIIRLVRDRGGRYRDAAALVRAMEGYGEHVRRVFARYGIPCFLDRRESATHHPLAELTRNAVRAAAYDWGHEDWFGALKSGLVSESAEAVDRLENEALRRGWSGETWFRPLPGDDETVASAERWRVKWIEPFARFRAALGAGLLFRPNGEDFAKAVRQLWVDLRVEKRLEEWSRKETFHATVWDQMNILLDDLAQAFAGEALPLRDWLAILEAGLHGLTVGVIPPALDQVLIGAIDRSRNPELKLALVLGMNETVFPAPPRRDSLLSEADRDELRVDGVQAGPTRLQLLGREQFLAYIACTRSRERLVLTYSERDNADAVLNPSPFLAHARKLFPRLAPESFAGPDWRAAERPCELVDRMVRTMRSPASPPLLNEVLTRPEFASLREQMRLASLPHSEGLGDLTRELYGPALKTSVSRLEDYAACAFKFFTRSGLRAEERQVFELDVRERGSFQHAVLAAFHERLRAENKRWRDLTPEEGRGRIRKIVDDLTPQFRDGLLASNPQARFSARTVAESLGDFVAASIEWMKEYGFDPEAAELAFGGEDRSLPAWEMDLGAGRRLLFRGIIDRIDLRRLPEADAALAIVMDYKSGARQLDQVLMTHGLQLQLAVYLAVLRRLTTAREFFGVANLIPAGMFYVNLRGRSERGLTRTEVLANQAEARQAAFQHLGRFDFAHLPQIDNRGASEGAQFHYKLKKDGQPNATVADAMTSESFLRLLDEVEEHLRRMGREIYEGVIEPNPFRKGSQRACEACVCQAVCRFDPWTDSFRLLKQDASD